MEHSHSGRRRARWSRWMIAMALAAAAGATRAEAPAARAPDAAPAGEHVPSEYALARIPNQSESIRLFGNYYFFDPARSDMGPVLGSLLGGFRASTGVVGLHRSVSLFEIEHEEALNVPYVGLGYSRLWFTGALSLNADVGVVSQSGLNASHLHSLFGGTQWLDDSAGEARWAPVMAVNLHYSF